MSCVSSPGRTNVDCPQSTDESRLWRGKIMSRRVEIFQVVFYLVCRVCLRASWLLHLSKLVSSCLNLLFHSISLVSLTLLSSIRCSQCLCLLSLLPLLRPLCRSS